MAEFGSTSILSPECENRNRSLHTKPAAEWTLVIISFTDDAVIADVTASP